MSLIKRGLVLYSALFFERYCYYLQMRTFRIVCNLMFSPSLVFKTSIIEQRNRVLFVNSWSVRHPTSPGRIIAHYSPSRVLGGCYCHAGKFRKCFSATALLATPISKLSAAGDTRQRTANFPRAGPVGIVGRGGVVCQGRGRLLTNTVKPNYCIQHYILVQTAHALQSQPPKIYCYFLILRQV